MRKLVGLVLVLGISVGLALAQGTAAKKPAAAGSSAAEELKQAERDWIAGRESRRRGQNRSTAHRRLERIGTRWDEGQQAAISGGLQIGSQQNRVSRDGTYGCPVFGSIGVVQGSDTEKSSYKGKDTSGKYVWMDVFQKKNGKWQAVRSQVAKVQP